MFHFLNLVPVLLAIVQRKKKGAEEQAVNRQTALFTLKLLCKNFGAENPEPFVPVLNTAVRLIAPEKRDEKNVLGSALLCVAEVASTLGALAIPQLPRYAGPGRSPHPGVLVQTGRQHLSDFVFSKWKLEKRWIFKEKSTKFSPL